MKKVILTLAVVSSVFAACKGEKKEKTKVTEAKEVTAVVAKTSNVNEVTSVLHWKGSKPTGTHNGTVALQSGSVAIKEGKLTGGEFVIDMSSIKVLDIPADKAGNAKLVGHLTSGDFFDIATYPTSKFVITDVVEAEGKANITGNLTIKDVTKSITIPAVISTDGEITTLKSDTFNIDRADFNVKYGSKKFFPSLGDKFIDDIMELSFEVRTKA